MSNTSLKKSIPKSKNEIPHCLNCTHREQRFNFDVEKINGECRDCIKESNHAEMSEELMHGIK
jgi:hypothetical protein